MKCLHKILIFVKNILKHSAVQSLIYMTMVFSIKYDLFLSILYKFLLTKSTHTTTERIYCKINKSTDDLFAENATNQIYDTGRRSVPEMDYIRTPLLL